MGLLYLESVSYARNSFFDAVFLAKVYALKDNEFISSVNKNLIHAN